MKNKSFRISEIDPNNRDAMLIKAGALNESFRLDEAGVIIDKERTDNFMKNEWVYDIDTVKPTLKELFSAIKAIKKFKK